MTAYLISEVVVKDQAALEKYRDLAAVTHAAYGGGYIVRGGAITVLEGDRHPQLLVIGVFPDVDSVKRWYVSDEYAEALQYRDAAFSSRNLMIVEGYKPPA